jgi:hypothetical protein
LGTPHQTRVRSSCEPVSWCVFPIERKINEATALGAFPTASGEESHPTGGREFRSDKKYRQAVLEFEESEGRFPIEKPEDQFGHDIDSFTHEEGQPDRQLIRRIEVKGKGVRWETDQAVEMSDRQFTDAFNRKVEDSAPVAKDFDYWLYVVEEDGQEKLTVLPIRNPARQAARYELRGGTWRHLAEYRETDR